MSTAADQRAGWDWNDVTPAQLEAVVGSIADTDTDNPMVTNVQGMEFLRELWRRGYAVVALPTQEAPE